MIRLVSAMAIGLLAFLVVTVSGHRVAMQFWPEYAAAFPTRNFNLSMLIARHSAGIVGTIAGGFAATAFARQDRRPALWLAILGLGINLPVHLTEPVWSAYPPLYHYVFFAYLLIGPLVGRWLSRRTSGSNI